MLIRPIKSFISVFKNAFLETVKQTFLADSMNDSDALKIMNLTNNYDGIELESKFKDFYMANSKKNGGSEYIQSKIKNAYLYLKNKKLEYKDQTNLCKI